MSQPAKSAETLALLRYLNAQRDHVLGILDGLGDETLRQPILPSGWTSPRQVQHLTLDVERFWFAAVVAGNPAVIDSLAEVDNTWQVGPDRSAQTVFDLYRQEIERANTIINSTPPDTPPAWWPGDLFGDFRLHTLREIILHVMAETASHSGHLDAARELIDGKQWMVMSE